MSLGSSISGVPRTSSAASTLIRSGTVNTSWYPGRFVGEKLGDKVGLGHKLASVGWFVGGALGSTLNDVWRVVGNKEGNKESTVGWFVMGGVEALVGGWFACEDCGDKVGVAGDSAGDALGGSIDAVGWFESDELDRNESVKRCVGWLFDGELAGEADNGGWFAREGLRDGVAVGSSVGELLGNGLGAVGWFVGGGVNVALTLGLKFGTFITPVWEPTSS